MDIVNEPAAVSKPMLVLRENYRPFAWNVPQIELEFDLDLSHAQVTSTLHVERNPKAETSAHIRLNGSEIYPLSVKVDGQRCDQAVLEGSDLVITLPGESHVIEIVTALDPSANSTLNGLYASDGILCTQCEAEGFRRITFFPDRPDVLSTYRVKMRASQTQFPILLCNGNHIASGTDEEGYHWAEWHDPWPKPSYLFALVAGDLVAHSSHFTTMSGREIELNVWVREDDLPRTHHAMQSLRKSMKWDEEVFGREYDLDLYNIVAVSDFNMGAMENKGLNIFNTKYVLADEDTATDADFDAVEGVIAHEYFHNWSGNRITCRDWFQLSLKEGFTVLRDQLFSQDMRGEAVKRIEDVRVLRAAQFPEDSGPLAHPVRPDSYGEIANFYTATVYNKGAEVIRMMRTLANFGNAADRFRAGTDLYFERHDGEAATCEDFVCAIEEGAGLDLKQFRLWYSQAGTPKVTAHTAHRGDEVTLTLSQHVPKTVDQPYKEPMTIPLRIAWIDSEDGTHRGEELIVLTKAEQSFTFTGYPRRPVLSINRGFTAPVLIEREASREELMLLAARDDDPIARAEALQELVLGHLVGGASQALNEQEHAAGEAAILEAMRAIVCDDGLDDAMRGELLMLPGDSYIFEQIASSGVPVDPGAIHTQRQTLRQRIGDELEAPLQALYERVNAVGFEDRGGRGARKVKTQVLGYIAASDPGKAANLAAQQYRGADNMTDRQGALGVLAGLGAKEREEALADFYTSYRDNALVIDKWFTLQALSLHPQVIEQVKALGQHEDFTLHNPNRVRALFLAFASNAHAFHTPSGEGYELITDLILKLDPINPQTAARFVATLDKWRKLEPVRAERMRAQLMRISQVQSLSRDTFEQGSRTLV